ncbi:DMT family transporter [Candidatus Poribacteria bacterium]|nr:DMT family transporter [Candidatus Poribacteria bacterium]
MKKGIISIIFVAFIWGGFNVFIKALSSQFDVVTQSFFWYLSGGTVALLLSAITVPKELLVAVKNIKLFFVPTILIAIHLLTFIQGVYMTNATSSALIAKLNAIFVPILSFVFFPDERRIVKNKKFLLGTFLAFVGVVGVILTKSQSSSNYDSRGAILLVFSMLWIAVYVIKIKTLVQKIHPLVIIACVPLLGCLILLPLVLVFGNLHKILEVDYKTAFLLLGASAVSLGAGDSLYYYSIRHLGASISTSFLLITPLITGVLGFFALGERLTTGQMLFSIILIVGCLLTVRVKNET